MTNKKIKIGVFTDLRFTALETPTGVTKHIVEMVNGLAVYSNIEVIILATKDQLTKNGEIPKNNALSHFTARKLPYTWHTAYLLWLTLKFPYMDQHTHDLDWVYCPKNDFIPLRKTKTVFTIHGAHEIDPDYPNDNSIKGILTRLRSKTIYKAILKQGDYILTVSHFLKNQMIKWFDVDSEKIIVVGNGAESLFFSSQEKHLPTNNHSTNQLLSVGGLNYLDGGDRIIKLAKHLKSIKSNYKILVAGNQHKPDLLHKAKELSNIELAGYVTAPDLSELMQSSNALLFLTRYETFGIAAIEAMASRLPVITSHNTAIPEIVEDAALYVNPDNPTDILNNIEKLNHSNLRMTLIKEGYKKAENYTWDKCVKRLYSIIEN